MRCWLWTLMTIGFVTGTAFAAEPTPLAVDSLIEKLGDPVFAEREVAQRHLLHAGVENLLALELAAVTHADAEVRQRAAMIAHELQRAAKSARYITAKLVTLEYVNQPLSKAVAGLRTKTGINVQLDPKRVAELQRPITVKTATVPVWEAVEQFRVAAGLQEIFREELNGPPVGSSDQFMGRRRVSYYGPVANASESANQVPVTWADGKAAILAGDRSSAIRVMALPARFPGNRIIHGSGQVIFNLDVTPPTDLRWEEVTTVRIERAEDETGRPIMISHPTAPSNPNNYYNEAFFGGGLPVAWQLDGYGGQSPSNGRPNPRIVPVTLKSDDRMIRSLNVLHGSVTGIVTLTNQEVLSFTDLSKSSGATRVGPNDMKLTILNTSTLPDGRTSLRFRTEGPNPWALARQNRFGGVNNFAVIDNGGLMNGNLSRFRFTDVEGHTLLTPLIQSSNMNDDGVRQTAEYELVFQKHMGHGAPYKLTMTGNKPLTVEVPFKMQNVMLP